MRSLLIMVLCVVALLAGCASLTDVKDLVIRDAKLAAQWATEDNDELARLCYRALVEVGEALTPAAEREPIGALSAEYLARHARRTLDSAKDSVLLLKLRIGCGPLLLEKRDLAIKLGIRLGLAGM